MFLKRCTRKKDGKPHTYRQLVESYRTPRGPRHRVVAYLGELDKSERRIGRLLGRNPRAAGGFKIELAEDKTSPAGLQLRWSRVEAWRQWTRLCCITQPDPAQRALLDRMGLVIPGRLGRPSWVRTPKL